MKRWLPLAAYLPALTFFGHWPLSIDIPGTSFYVGLPKSGSSQDVGHESHCHASAGSSSNTPLPATPTVAALTDSQLTFGGDPPRIGVAKPSIRWFAQTCIAPIPPPPEHTFQS